MTEEKTPTIKRSPHNKENPYVMINRDLIRDKSVSLRCRAFIIFCLSFDENWEISIPTFMRMQGIGRNVMYSIIDEAIEVGYIEREKYKEHGLTRFQYRVAESPIFKKSLPYAEKPHAVFPHAENLHTKKEQLSSSSNEEGREKKEQCKEGSTPSQPSAEALYLADFFLRKLRERNPEFKEPDLKKWQLEMDRLLRIDKRELQKTVALIEWAAEDKWWKANCLSPQKLRKEYDHMTMQMAAGSEKELIRKNRNWALKQKETYPKELKALSFDDKFAMNRELGKEVPFNLPSESFHHAFASLFGGQITGDRHE